MLQPTAMAVGCRCHQKTSPVDLPATPCFYNDDTGSFDVIDYDHPMDVIDSLLPVEKSQEKSDEKGVDPVAE